MMDHSGIRRVYSYNPPDSSIVEQSGSEKEVSNNRLGIGTVLSVYAVYLAYSHSSHSWRLSALIIGFYAGAIAFAVVVRRWPQPSPLRLIMGVVFDVATISLFLGIAGKPAAPAFPAYLWLIVGNGFRFGIAYLRLGATLSVVGFAMAAVSAGLVLSEPAVMAACLGSLTVVPSYIEVLLRRELAVARRAREASEAKSRLLTRVSHDLRTPLAAITGFSDLLEQSGLTPSQREMVGSTKDAAATLLGLINDLLDMSRLQSGEIRLATKPFALTDMLTKIMKMLTPAAEAKGLRLHLYADPTTPTEVEGDTLRISQILFNLVSNAVKFTDRGYVSVGIETRQLRDAETWLRFEVADTGIGIPPQFQGKIFENFGQVDPEITRRYGGSGLGLSIAKQMTQLLGGTIDMRSTAGEGSRFWFEIPLQCHRAEVAEEPPRDLGVVILTSDLAGVQEIVAQLRRLAIPTSVLATPRKLAGVLAPAAENLERFAVIIDGRGGALDDLLRTSQSDPSLRGAPLILLAHTIAMPAPAVRRYFATSIAPNSGNDEILGALRLARSVGSAGAAVVRLPSNRPRPSKARARSEGGRPRLRVLVSEDNRTNQVIFRKTLEHAGHACTIVSNGDEALERLERREVDVMLVDVHTPVMDGIELSQMVQFAIPDENRPAIVGLTADSTEETRRRCQEAGMDAFLTKPVSLTKLVEVIEETATASGYARKQRASITELSAHPRFKTAEQSAVESRMVEELYSIGGTELIQDVSDALFADIELVGGFLGQAIEHRDQALFMAQLTSLRSIATNIGASELDAIAKSEQTLLSAGSQAEAFAFLERIKKEVRRIARRLNHDPKPDQPR